MTKEKMIKLIDDLIKSEMDSIDECNSAIEKMSDSSRIVAELGVIYQEKTHHIRMLNDLKTSIENHDKQIRDVSRLYGLEHEMDDGIRIDVKEEE